MNTKLGVRTAIVGIVVVVLAVLAGVGIIGPAVGPERITAHDVTATVTEGGSVRVREVIDWDFSLNLGKHGIFRRIPNDAGVPTEITVESPDAPDEVLVSQVGNQTELRIGSPS